MSTIAALRRLNGVLLALIFAACIAAYARLPERIPVHFGLHGRPDVWAQRSWLTWLMLPLLSTVLAVLLHGLAEWSARRPERLNVPDKELLLRLPAEQRAPIVNSVLRFLAWTAILLTVFLASIQLAIYRVAMGFSAGLPGTFMITLAFTMAFIIVGAVRLNQRIRQQIRRAAGAAR